MISRALGNYVSEIKFSKESVLLTKFVASTTPLDGENGTGSANRKSPIGGCAYGIPKYVETFDRNPDAFP